VRKDLHKEMLLVCVDQKREVIQGQLRMHISKQREIIENTKINALPGLSVSFRCL